MGIKVLLEVRNEECSDIREYELVSNGAGIDDKCFETLGDNKLGGAG